MELVFVVGQLEHKSCGQHESRHLGCIDEDQKELSEGTDIGLATSAIFRILMPFLPADFYSISGN